MIKQVLKQALKQLTGHQFIAITGRGSSAIEAATKDKKVLIPEEGGWLSYQKILDVVEVKCVDAKIDLNDLKEKSKSSDAFLYQQPGGYFAEQNAEEIYKICKNNNCQVIIDVSGCLGTKLCQGKHADILVGSFGKWKLVEARVGGFISCKNEEIFNKLKVAEFIDDDSLKLIEEKLAGLKDRINFLLEKRKEVLKDLKDLDLVHPNDFGFVVVIKFTTKEEKEKIINYCGNHDLEWTECPRYIRLNKPAISIEIKRLQN